MNMLPIMLWMVSEKMAQNEFAASAIVNGLKLWELDNVGAMKARVLCYRKWRPKQEKQLTPKQAFDLAIAGIDRDDVIDRQIEMELS